MRYKYKRTLRSHQGQGLGALVSNDLLTRSKKQFSIFPLPTKAPDEGSSYQKEDEKLSAISQAIFQVTSDVRH